jgi:hypothetical protein
MSPSLMDVLEVVDPMLVVEVPIRVATRSRHTIFPTT